MYIKVNNKKLNLVELKTFKERFKSLKFNFETLNYAIKFPNKRILNTIFFVQKVDVMITDKDDKIIYLKKNVRSEKYFIHKRGGKDIYILPLGTIDKLNIGKKINSYD
ncbi:MAG: hypothetical protein IJI43_01460 [Bacilli bacterium]|nr:hypothetical protein [Bacilli bacterium]